MKSDEHTVNRRAIIFRGMSLIKHKYQNSACSSVNRWVFTVCQENTLPKSSLIHPITFRLMIKLYSFEPPFSNRRAHAPQLGAAHCLHVYHCRTFVDRARRRCHHRRCAAGDGFHLLCGHRVGTRQVRARAQRERERERERETEREREMGGAEAIIRHQSRGEIFSIFISCFTTYSQTNLGSSIRIFACVQY